MWRCGILLEIEKREQLIIRIQTARVSSISLVELSSGRGKMRRLIASQQAMLNSIVRAHIGVYPFFLFCISERIAQASSYTNGEAFPIIAFIRMERSLLFAHTLCNKRIVENTSLFARKVRNIEKAAEAMQSVHQCPTSVACIVTRKMLAIRVGYTEMPNRRTSQGRSTQRVFDPARAKIMSIK